MRLVLGLQCVREAIRVHGGRLERVLVERRSPPLDALARFATDRGATVERVDRATLDKLSRGTRHQGAAAYAPPLRFHPLDDVLSRDRTFVIALDEIQDPQNFGAIVRSAVALGGAAVLWPEHASAPLTPATFRASAGAIEHAVLCRVPSLRAALVAAAERGAAIVGLDSHADLAIVDVDLRGPAVLVVGSEGTGLRKSIRAACTSIAKLLTSGVLDSLNASAAVAVAAYEVVRQRSSSR